MGDLELPSRLFRLKTGKVRKSEMAIVRFLARNPSSTRKRIADKAGLTWKTTDKVIKDLVVRRVVEEVSRNKFRTGLDSPCYSITFVGFLYYLAYAGSDLDIGEAVKKYQSLFNARILDFDKMKGVRLDGKEVNNIWPLYSMAAYLTVMQLEVAFDDPKMLHLIFPFSVLMKFEEMFTFNILLILARQNITVKKPVPEFYEEFRTILTKFKKGYEELELLTQKFAA